MPADIVFDTNLCIFLFCFYEICQRAESNKTAVVSQTLGNTIFFLFPYYCKQCRMLIYLVPICERIFIVLQ